MESFAQSILARPLRSLGWVWRRRDFGGLIFVDLRDREGLTQILFDPDVDAETFATAETIRPEWPVFDFRYGSASL